MGLVGQYVRRETGRLAENGVRLQVIGRRDRLGSTLRRAIREAERRCSAGTRLHLRIALDYSGREAIARAARRFARDAEPSLERFGQLLAASCRDGPAVPEVDLMIRTGGERRLSDFLLWECAYAELYFTDRMWPDFDHADFREALRDFARRERRFGSLPTAADGVPQLRKEKRA
jgi:undecaprenyl diphosphate synthase